MRTRILLAVLAAVLAAAPARGQSKAGTTMGKFLLIAPSARIAAMGNAGASLADGLDAAYYNPGVIGRLDRPGLYLVHSAWIADIGYDWVAGALPTKHLGVFTATVTSLSSGDMPVRTVNMPYGTGELFSVQNFAFALGWGLPVTDRFSAGVQANYVQETIYHSSTSFFTFNIGTYYEVGEDGLRLGASLSNFGTEAGYEGRDLRVSYDAQPDVYGDNGQLPASQVTDEFQMPVVFRVGVGMPFRFGKDARLVTALDAAHPADADESVNLGAELTLRQALALRVGYQELFVSDSEAGLTLGAGFAGRLDAFRYRLDYGWADFGRLGSTQRFAVGLTF